MESGGKTTEEWGRWYLESVADAGREWMVAIESVPFIIGRDTVCNLQLTDKWISRRHSEIHISGGHLWIRDLGSKNGTFVNQQQIKQAELLEAGDGIAIGKFNFRVKHLELDAAGTAEETSFLSDEFHFPASIEPRLRALISARRVLPHFQPILNIQDRSLVGYEILGRVADKDLPQDPPELFEMAEWFGCGPELSTLFREEGVKRGKHLPGGPVLFANVTPIEIHQMDALLDSLAKVHEMAGDNKVVIEVNEKAVNDTAEMIRLRDTLKKFDMGLAFDDFGVGQTRLVELAKVPPDFLKFDISLIRKIHVAPTRLHQMVSTFVKATQDLGIATIAEGVECLEEAEACQQLGFDLAQGYFYGRPLPPEEIKSPASSD